MIDVEVCEVEKEDYEFIEKWWMEHQGSFNIELQSPYGLVCFMDQKPVAHCSIFLPKDSLVAQLGWVVSDPKSDRDTRDLALTVMLGEVESYVGDMGYKYVWLGTENKALQDRAEDHEYIGGMEMKQYWKVIKNVQQRTQLRQRLTLYRET